LNHYKTLTFRVKGDSILRMKVLSPLPKIESSERPTLGCDPEFFFESNGEVLESEKVLPKRGLRIDNGDGKEKRVSIDGVQAEINPRPDACRGFLGSHIRECFILLKEKIKKDENLKVSFDSIKKLSKKKLDSLSDSSKRFGCEESKNINSELKNGAVIIKADPNTYKVRSAGGHIHLGKTQWNTKAFDDPKLLVKMLDILLGNTCVLMDRSRGNVERRKHYGGAGEYRTPKHGLEYRTLSNFWLRDYALMSFVTGMARYAVQVILKSTDENNYAKEFLSAVDYEDIKKAINKNDYKLALSNFNKIKPIICQISPEQISPTYSVPLTGENMPYFEQFIKKDHKRWFRADPFRHWTNLIEDWDRPDGWENWLEGHVEIELPELSPAKIVTHY